MTWLRAILVFLIVVTPGAALANPFASLRAAYASRDANAAAASYAPDALVVYRYAGTPEERHEGTRAIAGSFAALFDQIDARDALDLNFRETYRNGNHVRGYYRLRVGRSQTSYGRFDVVIDESGKFTSDQSSDATRDEFEEANGPVLLAVDDETLDRRYYARLTGRYRLPNGCILIVTQSIVRLFVRNSCTNAWRGLSRVSGRHWTAGDSVLAQSLTTTFRFAPINASLSPYVDANGVIGTDRAMRLDAYRAEDVTFRSQDGTLLSGTLQMPTGGIGRQPASVMIHGSGAQDRNGYASIIAVLADELAASGRVVLSFDKRGSGESFGEGERAGFDALAGDVRAAMAYLASRDDIDPARIGLAGTSQAGWVAARAIADGAAPADVVVLGAAGTALTVVEQNLYNTEVRMRCARIAESDIHLALRQQSAFFAFLRDASAAARLDRLTAEARMRPALGDWLFPDSRTADQSAAAWYVVLDPTFDPLPIWRRYSGRALFLFSQFDDSTPTSVALQRLRGLPPSVEVLANAQHLGLMTSNICQGELAGLTQFSPQFFPQIAHFARPTP